VVGEENARICALVTDYPSNPPQALESGTNQKEEHPYGAIADCEGELGECDKAKDDDKSNSNAQ